MRYRLRTLLILLAILPPLLWLGWRRYEAWRAEQGRIRAVMLSGSKVLTQVVEIETVWVPDLRQAPAAPAAEEAEAPAKVSP